MKSHSLFQTNPAIALVNAINPYSKNPNGRRANISSRDALNLIEKITKEELNEPCIINTKMNYTHCELEDNVKLTLGTQCLIYLFDPGNGWIRDCFKRGDMLLMTARLVERGVSLDGLYCYRGNSVIKDQSFKQIIQSLINKGFNLNDPPAMLNDEIIEIFTQAGYEFSYPPEYNIPSFDSF